MVFNRWGNQVYYAEDYKNDWNGGDLNASTYYYVITLRSGARTELVKGWVTIVR